MTPTSRPPAVRWLVVAFLIGFAVLGQFNRYTISVAGNAHFIGPDRLSKEEMGFVYSAFLVVYTAGMLPGGWLIDRLGPRRALAGMGLGLGCCTVLTGSLGWLGLAVPVMFLPLLVIRGAAGAVSVPLHPGAARSVSLWLAPAERATGNGLITAGALVGIAASYPVFGALMDRLGWPTAFVACGAVLVAFALAWAAVVPRDPAPAVAPGRGLADTLRDLLGLLGNRSLVLLTLSYGAVGYFQYLFFYWVEYYFGKVLELDPAASREASFTITISMAVGMAVGGWVSDWLGRRLGRAWGYRLAAMTSMGLCAAFGVAGVYTRDPQQVVWLLSLALGTLGLAEGIFWTTAATLGRKNGGLACALMNTGGNGLGMLAPVLTPLLAGLYDWQTAVVVAGAVAVLGGVLWLAIDPAPRE